jgi:hypothetical protein
MSIETLGDAFRAGWKVKARCAWGKHDGMKSIRECIARIDLDMPTLAWARGDGFPLARLESRLKCPTCGSRKVRVVFDIPSNEKRMIA